MEGVLDIRLLGEPLVLLAGRPLSLPPSKKTRALLSYLALTGRAHRREKLCGLLWDVTDDPRAALRWSLTKLRELVDSASDKRLIADRESVQLDARRLRVDALEVQQLLRGALEDLPIATLEAAVGMFRGELLEGLDLPEFQGYHAFCIAEREALRRLHSRALSALLVRYRAQPERALPLSRQLLEIEPLNGAVRAQFMELLHQSGRAREAEDEARTSKRFLPSLPARAVPEPAPRESQLALARRSEPGLRLIGRVIERAQIAAALVAARAGQRVILLEAEAGVGKTRLVQEVTARQNMRFLSTSASELLPGSPYAPWLGLLGAARASALEPSEDAELTKLMSELSGTRLEGDPDSVRRRLFQGVESFLTRMLAREKALVLVIDDAHWLDEGSVALLQHVLDANASRPLSLLLAARPGALADNLAMLRVLRALRRRGVLEEFSLAALSADETRELLHSLESSADPERVYRESAGNPLFALELARAPKHAEQGVPVSITRVVRDRLATLPAEAADALRWASLLGTQFDPALLDRLLALDAESYVSALEQLERHGWLVFEALRARFSHEIVRSAIYDGLSGPRRALMHQKVARLYSEAVDADGTRAAELARHAALGGDHTMAARACATAARRCLRLGARADTHALARMGLSYVEGMNEPERTTLTIELMDLSFVSHRPPAEAQLSEQLSLLSARALELGAVDPARRAMFLSVLVLWEDGHTADAERFTREVERISRQGSPRERAHGLGDAAHCLASLERDLPEAEALLREAEHTSQKAELEIASVALARASLHAYRDELSEADAALTRASELARADGDRLAEMHALEWGIDVAFRRGDYARAERLSQELIAVGEKSRAGSELPFARAALALARFGAGQSEDTTALDQAFAALDLADAKRRSAILQAHAAELAFTRGMFAAARERAAQTLPHARALDRPSDVATALSILVQVSSQLTTDGADAERVVRELIEAAQRPLSVHARQRADAALAHAQRFTKQGVKTHGTRHGRTRIR